MTTLIEKLKQRKEAQAAKRARGVSTVRLKDGKNLVRILPSWTGDKDDPFFHEFGLHYIKVPGSAKPDSVYMCYSRTYDTDCPICEAISEGIKASSDDEINRCLNESKAAGRVLVNALMLDSENPHEPVVLELPRRMFEEDIVEAVLMAAEEGDDLLSLDEGFHFIIEKTGKGIDTKYHAKASRKSSSVPKEVMNKVTNLDDFVNQKSEAIEKKALLSVRKAIGGGSATALIGGGASLLEEEASTVRTGTDDAAFEVTSESKTAAKTASVESAIVEADFTEVSEESKSSGGDDIDDLLAELDNL